ncbi:hypothetical protein Tco_1530406 [Tanacetum coccineum]
MFMQVLNKIVKDKEVAKEHSLDIPTVEKLLDESGDKDDDAAAHSEQHLEDYITNDLLASADLQVSADIQSFMPTLISDALKHQLPVLLSEASKDCMPSILKKSLQTHIPAVSEQFENKQTQLHKKLVMKMNKQFHLAHHTESEKFVVLQKELTKVLQSDMGQTVKSQVRSDMQNTLQVVQHHPQSAVVINEIDEQPLVSKVAIEELAPLNTDAKVNEEKSLVLLQSEEKREAEQIDVEDSSKSDELDNQPLSKRFKIITLIPEILKPTPIRSILPEAIDLKVAKKVGLPPPPKLATFRMTAEDKKRKRSYMIKHMFVKEDVVVDGTQRNVAPPSDVIGKSRFVIRELEAGFFYLNRSCDLVFQMESESRLTSTVQLIRLQRIIIQDSPKAREMFKIMEYEIKSRDDVIHAREIVEKNLDGMGMEPKLSAKHQLAVKGLSECKASDSNIKHIQVKDVVKKVEDYLKTYSSAGMDISWKLNKCLWRDKHRFKLKSIPSMKLVKVVNSWKNCSLKYGRSESKNRRALNTSYVLHKILDTLQLPPTKESTSY